MKKLTAIKFNMYLNRFYRSNHNFIPEVDDPDRLITHNNAPNESSYHTTRATREILAQKVYSTGAYMHALKVRDGGGADNVNEDIDIENKVSELDHG